MSPCHKRRYIWYISDYFKHDYTNKIKDYRETETSDPLLAALGDGGSSPEWGWSWRVINDRMFPKDLLNIFLNPALHPTRKTWLYDRSEWLIRLKGASVFSSCSVARCRISSFSLWITCCPVQLFFGSIIVKVYVIICSKPVILM